MTTFTIRRLAAAFVCLLALRGNAGALMLAGDVVPAATLLLPYFETKLDDPNGASTVFTVANASRDPQLAHVTLWTDLGVPSFNFDVYLAGYDMVEVDLRLVFAGILPQTGPTVTNRGTHSGPAVSFPGCDGRLAQGRLAPALVSDLRSAHTGAASGLWGGMCGARPVGDSIARGYVTVDVVNRCSTKFPGDPASGDDPAYFVFGGTGIAGNANVLWGEFVFNERGNNFAYGDTLVHIEAQAQPFPGDFTFYGRRVAASEDDNREPLASIYFGRYVNDGIFDGGSHALVWRDPGVVLPFVCGAALPRLQQREITPVDERDTATNLSNGFPLGFQSRLPWAAERIDTSDASRLPIPYDSGFLYLDLRLPMSVADPVFSGRNQGYVVMVHRANGRFAGATRAWPHTLDINLYEVP